MKKMNWFCEVLYIQMKMNDIACNFNSILFIFNWIEFHFNNWKEMGCIVMAKILKICSWMGYWLFFLEKTPFHPPLFGNGLNKFQIEIIQVMTMTYGT